MFMPVDLERVIADFRPPFRNSDEVVNLRGRKGTMSGDLGYLRGSGFKMEAEWLNALSTSHVDVVYAAPKGEYVDPREPVLTIRTTQAFASWLEPLLIGRVSYQMQVATAAKEAYSGRLRMVAEAEGRVKFIGTTKDPFFCFMENLSKVTCEEQKALTIEALVGAGFDRGLGDHITVDEEGYYNAVQAQCRKMTDTGVSRDRFFEVGLRAATCMDQHIIALKAMKDLGFSRTSNVYGAYLLDMFPVGTMGHEGVMRWGCDDELAFTKHQEALGKVTFLLDTNDTMHIGLPIAIAMMQKHPERTDGARPDSGDLAQQFRLFVSEMRRTGMERPWIFEDGMNAEKVAEYEALRVELGYPEHMVLYGAGGYFIDRPEPTGYTRGRINMVYKLSWTESYGAAMKFGDEAETSDGGGKESIPGVPVTYVRRAADTDLPPVVVGQECDVLPGYTPYKMGDHNLRNETPSVRPVLSETTNRFVVALNKQRSEKRLKAAKERT